MDVQEWMVRQVVDASTRAALDLDGVQVTSPVTVSGWSVSDGVAFAQVVFGPFPVRVRASGVRLLVDDAVSVDRFESELSMPAGQTFQADLTIGVS